jgi:hypothetical protein
MAIIIVHRIREEANGTPDRADGRFLVVHTYDRSERLGMRVVLVSRSTSPFLAACRGREESHGREAVDFLGEESLGSPALRRGVGPEDAGTLDRGPAAILRGSTAIRWDGRFRSTPDCPEGRDLPALGANPMRALLHVGVREGVYPCDLHKTLTKPNLLPIQQRIRSQSLSESLLLLIRKRKEGVNIYQIFSSLKRGSGGEAPLSREP